MSSGLEGRFYEADFPELEEIVVVQVKRIVDMGAYVSLLEYNGREGMMLLSELSKRRIRSVSKLLRVGRTEICMIVRLDKDKGYVDLSKKRVEPEDATAKEESFARAKAVHGILRLVASSNNVEVEELCNKIAWPLYKRYKDAYEAFRKHINEEINMWDEIDFSQPGQDLTDMAEKIKEDIETNLRRRLIQQQLRLRAKIECSCLEYAGIDAVKEALTKGLQVQKEEVELKINLVAHPVFVVTCTCRDKKLGMETIEESFKLIEECILSHGGTFKVAQMPTIVGDDDKKDEPEGDDDSGSSSSGEQSNMGELDEAQLKELENNTQNLVDGDDK
jgi:translation initiation factor 2 subunit 1